MWSDSKASAFATRFPGMWLNTQNITISKTPDPTIFPALNADLQTAMQNETAAYMNEFITGDENFFDFIDAKFTYVNQAPQHSTEFREETRAADRHSDLFFGRRQTGYPATRAHRGMRI